jgi:hypothetical protein
MEDKLPPRREILLGFAAFGISAGCLVAIWFALFFDGDAFPRPTTTLDFVRHSYGVRTAAVSLIIPFVSTFCIGPFWRSAPGWLALWSSGPYLLYAGISFIDWPPDWFQAILLFYGFIVFTISYLTAKVVRRCLDDP